MFPTATRNQDTDVVFATQAKSIPHTGSFTDQTEVLCSPSEHHMFCPEDRAMITQAEYGPSYVVIGSQVTDEQLMKLAKRVNTDLAALIAFRDKKR